MTVSTVSCQAGRFGRHRNFGLADAEWTASSGPPHPGCGRIPSWVGGAVCDPRHADPTGPPTLALATVSACNTSRRYPIFEAGRTGPGWVIGGCWAPMTTAWAGSNLNSVLRASSKRCGGHFDFQSARAGSVRARVGFLT